MKKEGPALESLTHRLAECPGDFLAEPAIGRTGTIRVSAVVSDTLINLGGRMLSGQQAQDFKAGGPGERNRSRLVLIACWLLNDPWFIGQNCFSGKAQEWLEDDLAGLAKLVDAEKFTSDPDRREELARMCLEALGLRPAGETATQAQDRLNSLDSIERSRIIRDTLEKEKRARELREQMRRKEAAEAAAKATRE